MTGAELIGLSALLGLISWVVSWKLALALALLFIFAWGMSQ